MIFIKPIEIKIEINKRFFYFRITILGINGKSLFNFSYLKGISLKGMQIGLNLFYILRINNY